MPRIPKENQELIKNGEAGGGGPRKAIDGFVRARLIEATETEEKESGYAGQDLKFEVVAPRAYKGTWIWEYISYNPNTAWKWEAFFEAFGYEPDSDTDEIVEDEEAFAVLDCSIEIQTKGKNKNKERTTIDAFLDGEDPGNLALVGD